MKYQVILAKKAVKNLRKIDKRYKGRILTALVRLSSEPYLGKSLVGQLSGRFSLKIWPYRIIYQILENKLIIYVIIIEHRQGVYNKYE